MIHTRLILLSLIFRRWKSKGLTIPHNFAKPVNNLQTGYLAY